MICQFGHGRTSKANKSHTGQANVECEFKTGYIVEDRSCKVFLVSTGHNMFC